MFFDAIRLLLLLAMSVVAILKIRASKIKRKRLAIILSVVLILILNSISGMFPVENLFIDFKSPESVFHYTTVGRIETIIYGNSSCMVYYSTGSTSYEYSFIPKTEYGYKIPGTFTTKQVSNKFDKDVYFDIYNVVGTSEYYVFGRIFSEENEIHIVDSNNQPVMCNIIETGLPDLKVVHILAFVENFTNEYYFLVNGEKMFVSD